MNRLLCWTAAGCVVALGMVAARGVAQGGAAPAGKADALVDLSRREGVVSVGGEWTYRDAKIIEAPFHTPDGKPVTTYDVAPRPGDAPGDAHAVDFNDVSKWTVLDPTTLGRARSTGRVCFCWYRFKFKVPAKVGELGTTGSTAVFQVTVDDYAEVWVNGKLPLNEGVPGGGGELVAGHNVPNRLVLGKNVKPGEAFDVAIFAMNGPISYSPTNYIFLRQPVKLEFYK